MLSVDEALARVLSSVTPMPVEPVALDAAYGRTLAENLIAPCDLPHWDNSAMDGYALRAADTADGEAVLRLNEVLAAGAWPTMRVEAGTATAVMTGAPIPDGADAVVMVEDTDRSLAREVRSSARAQIGQHIRRRGEDVRQGQLVVARGVRLTAAQVGLASGLGLVALPVARRPRLAVLSTGDEVVPPGQPLLPGQIASSNNASLVGLVRESGGVAIDLGIVRDTLDDLVAALRRGLHESVDAMVTTGGVSVGAFDFVKEAFSQLGADIDFWKVRMRPGKPLAFGLVPGASHGIPLFGLPGNPVSCMVNFLQFVRPWMRTAMGANEPFLPVIDATAGEGFREKPGRDTFFRVRLERTASGLVAWSTGSQSSGVLHGMASAHGFVLLGQHSPGVEAGGAVRVQVFDTSFLSRREPGYGWD